MKYKNDPDVMGTTPNTRRKVIEEKEQKKIKLLGKGATFLTLIKGFVCVSILYVPKSFVNGGWLWSIICLLISCCMTCYCAHLLLDARAAAKASSYTELGKMSYGTTGEILVNLAIGGS